MDIREITSQKELDTFVGSQKRSQFLQSWPWGEFQRSLPTPVYRLGVYSGDKLMASAQIIKRNLPLGRRYWYVPRGPVVDEKLPIDDYANVWRELMKEVVGAANTEGAMFIKFEPPLPRVNEHFFKSSLKSGVWQTPKFVQPQDTSYLDLNLTEDQLVAAMHPKTRYNIKLAERKGVRVRQDVTVHDFDDFWQLMEVTAKRDAFQHHSRAYYREMYRILGQSGFLKMFLAEYQGKIIAANLIILFGDSVTYLHGASGDGYREVMAPHLLQWRQIQEAKKLGFKYYDFWGIAPNGADEKHPWQGITRFKRGFSGSEFNYMGARDLILDTFWYRIYKTVQRLRF